MIPMKFFTCLVLLFPFFVEAQSTSGQFIINGKVNGVPEKSLVTLSDVNHPEDTLGRALVTNGVFVIKGKIAEPNLYSLNFHGVQKKSMVFMGNEQVSVEGDVQRVQEMVVKGSRNHVDFLQFQKIFNPLFTKLNQMSQAISGQQSMDPGDSMMIAYQALFDKAQNEIDRFIRDKKTSWVSPFLLVVTSEMQPDIALLEKRYSVLDPSVKNSFYGNIIQQQIKDSKIGAVGTDA